MAGNREVIFEFVRVGAALKVTAVDAATGIEATIVADPMRSNHELQRLARQKLEYVLARKDAARGR